MQKSRWIGGLVLAGCVLSLLGVGPVRSAEEWLAPALIPLDGALTDWLPAPADREWLDALAEPAARAFHAHGKAVLGDVRAAADGRTTLLVPVLGTDRERHELLLAAPQLEGVAAVEPGAVVSAHGVLLGFVREVSADGLRARVSLLGQPSLRPVAAQWCAVAGGRPVEVLVSGAGETGEGGGLSLRMGSASSRVVPPPGQPVATRDVSALGDRLPAGLLLGLVGERGTELPGGGWIDGGGLETPLVPALDPYGQPLAALEVAPGSALTARATTGRLSGTTSGAARLRLDAGSRRGVQRGDWVVQDGLFVGIVDVVAPYSSLLSVEVPQGALLVMSPAGEVVAAGVARESWPPGWEPARGDLLATGSVFTGGLVVGRVTALDGSGLRAQRLRPDPRRDVTVVGP
jgi:hypothetical protein